MTVSSTTALAPDAPEASDWSRLLSPLGQKMIAEPGSAAMLGEEQGARLLDSVASAHDLTAEALAAFTDVALPEVALPPADTLTVELADAWQNEGTPLTEAETTALHAETMTLDPRVEQALAELVNGETHARVVSQGAFQTIDLTALAAVLQHATPQPYGADATALSLLPTTDLDLSLMEETETLLASLDLAAIAAANLAMAEALDRAVAILSTIPDDISAPLSAPGDVFQYTTPYGEIAVSGSGPHTYTDRYFVLLDLGGDDTYNNPTGAVQADILASGVGATLHAANEALYALSTAPGLPPSDAFDQAWRDTFLRLVHQTHNASIAIDLDGDDTYSYHAAPAQGSGGFGGFGAVVDVAGKDSYSAYRHSQGDGQVAGVGLLMDLGGDDGYEADAQAQGFGQVGGLGALVDHSGTDTYRARVVAQGLGWDVGVGVLVDRTGNDHYTCWGVDDFSDSILPVNRPRPGTTCQATGWGGTGVLVDATGDDHYFTEAGFQTLTLLGTSLLVDGSGIDNHTAGEWSIGVGVLGASVVVDGTGNDIYDTHMVLSAPWLDIYIGGNGEGYVGVGVLADAAGDDVYTTDVRKDLFLVQYACGNGCAHDGGVGILADGGGTDSYTSEVGQGGTSGGVALLVDADGDDTYFLRYNSTRGQGFAGFDPITGPGLTGGLMTCIYGVLVDGDGTDSYSNPVVDFGTRADGSYWGQGEFGRGIDGTGGAAGYLTSSAFLADVNKLVSTAACNTVTN
ncbi:MAG: hypothetical protein KY455_03160 [Euryarchaeota archaeon]|nr:hypothetical protein [Euryarchaeota archaeon]